MSVVYLYGFVPGSTTLPESGLLGVGDATVELIPLDGFAAVVARLPDEEYAGDTLEARTADVEWMAEQGLRHEQVVAWFVDHTSILPSRLLTLFSTTDAVRAAAAADRDGIERRLERFAGVREWDLKVELDADRLGERAGEVSAAVAELDRRIAEATPGKRFLLERKRKDLVRTEVRAAARRLARELLATLEAEADDVVVMPPPTDDAPVVLNAALLVPTDREPRVLETVEAEAERLEALGLRPRFTGPWAPYRFMGEDHG